MQYTEISSNNLKMKFNVLCKTVSLSLNVLKQRKKKWPQIKKRKFEYQERWEVS